MREYHWIFPHLLYDSFLVACCECILSDIHSHHQHIQTLLAIQSWQQLLLSHETGIHWITIHMTIETHTIGCGPDYKTAAHCCSERPLGRDPVIEGKLY